MRFPIFKTKVEGVTQKFNLADPKSRRAYFETKAGPEIKKLRGYLGKGNTFVAYLLGKKNSGKGTYSKMFGEVFGEDKVEHFSIGDMIRVLDQNFKKKEKKKQIIEFLKKNYRGPLSLEKVLLALEKRNTKILLPTELILALVKMEITRRKKKALFIDGFPRDLDQISYSLFFRDLIGYRDDPDIFILIDVPEKVIDERIKWRRVCPICQTSRNLKLLPTSKIGYDKKNKEFYFSKKNKVLEPEAKGFYFSKKNKVLEPEAKGFYLICDNPNCRKAKMISKEGDKSGIGPIGDRLKMDEKLIEKSFLLYGIPKILLRNSISVREAKNFVDDYEITPEYCYEWDEVGKKVRIKEKPWIITDDSGVPSYSLLAPPVVISLIKQMVDVLGI